VLSRDIRPPALRSERWRWLAQTLEVAVVLAALGTVPLVVAHLRDVTGPDIVIIDWVIWSIFFIEYLMMMALRSRHACAAPQAVFGVCWAPEYGQYCPRTHTVPLDLDRQPLTPPLGGLP
jgi:hypothetical protein